MILPGPVAHIDIHQVCFKLDGKLARLRDNLGCLARALQRAADYRADGQHGQRVGQAFRLLFASIGQVNARQLAGETMFNIPGCLPMPDKEQGLFHTARSTFLYTRSWGSEPPPPCIVMPARAQVNPQYKHYAMYIAG